MKKKITIGIVLLVIMGLSGCTDIEKPEYWTWELSAGERINVTFTDQMIDCTGSNKTEALFVSILNLSGELLIFQEYPSGNLESWLSSRPSNELKYIQPDILCSVHVEKNCTLRIKKC